MSSNDINGIKDLDETDGDSQWWIIDRPGRYRLWLDYRPFDQMVIALEGYNRRFKTENTGRWTARTASEGDRHLLRDAYPCRFGRVQDWELE